MLLNVNFSSRTTSMDVQRNLEANVEKRTKDTYGPPPGEWMEHTLSLVHTHTCKQTHSHTPHRQETPGVC